MAYQKPWALKPRGTLTCTPDCVHMWYLWISLLSLEAGEACVDTSGSNSNTKLRRWGETAPMTTVFPLFSYWMWYGKQDLDLRHIYHWLPTGMWCPCLPFESFCSYGGIQFATEDWINHLLGSLHTIEVGESRILLLCPYIEFSSILFSFSKYLRLLFCEYAYVCMYVCVCTHARLHTCVRACRYATVCLWSSQDNFMMSVFFSYHGFLRSSMYKQLYLMTHLADSTLGLNVFICAITNIYSCKTHYCFVCI